MLNRKKFNSTSPTAHGTKIRRHRIIASLERQKVGIVVEFVDEVGVPLVQHRQLHDFLGRSSKVVRDILDIKN